jgi:hypothetical protein
MTWENLALSRITLSDGHVIAAFDGLPSSGSRLAQGIWEPELRSVRDAEGAVAFWWS